VIWRKELPVSEKKEEYHLRYMSRNLLVFSEQRALLMNSMGHVIYDLQFENKGAYSDIAAELFEYKGHVYSCFVQGSQVVIYEDYKEVVTLMHETPSQNYKPI
jgi:hypothetical protein